MYDASKGGLAEIARWEKSKRKRLTAKLIRANANKYSSDKVEEDYKLADKLDKEADKDYKK